MYVPKHTKKIIKGNDKVMSKNISATAKKGLSQTAKKALVISVICVVTAIVIAVSLILALKPVDSKFVADTNNPTTDSSTLTIKNGNFEYVNEAKASYPLSASNWSKYGYKAPTGSGSSRSQGYTTLGTNTDTVMGVIDTKTENWETVSSDLSSFGVELSNPGKPGDSETEYNVYMIHNKTDFAASIYSQSFSVPSSTSVKITVSLKTVDVTGAGAFAMFKYNSSSALNVSNSGIQYWYAYQFGIDTKGEWQTFEFYIFNQTSSSKTIYANLGLGNVYNNETATGTLFIDDIKYDSDITANDYRLKQETISDPDDNTCYVIERETTDNVVNTVNMNTNSGVLQTLNNAQYMASADSKVDGTTYSPFLSDDEVIYSMGNDGTDKAEVSALSDEIQVTGPSTNKQLHLSLWVRTMGNNAYAATNIYLVETGAEDDHIASFTNIKPADDITKDENNGWYQYHFYLKPGEASTSVRVLVVFGQRNGYNVSQSSTIANGKTYLTAVKTEEISQSEYASASTGTYVSKYDFDTSSSLSITNGSFDDIVTNSPGTGLLYPSSWTPVFAGSNAIYNDGRDNTFDGEFVDPVTVPHASDSVTSGVYLGFAGAPTYDTSKKSVLQITNNVETAFGYLSQPISLNANSVTVISVLAKGEGNAVPYVYLFEDLTSEEETVVYQAYTAKVTNAVSDETFNMVSDSNGWTRYYFVVATGDNAKTVKLALFNGAIDASVTDGVATGVQQGTVYFDQATYTQIGTYTRDVEGSKEAEDLTYTAVDGYTELDEMELEGFDNVKLVDLRLKDVNEPAEEEEEEDGDTTTPSQNNVDVALLVSIISSALLVAALLIVIVVKLFFKKKS